MAAVLAFACFLVATVSAAPSWEMQTPNVAGIALAIDCTSDAATCYLPSFSNGIGQQLLKSTDGCQTFQVVPIKIPLLELLLTDVATEADSVLVTTIGDCLYSNDAGVTWHNSTSGGTSTYVVATGTSGQDFAIVGDFTIRRIRGYAKTTDGGNHFTYYSVNMSTTPGDIAFPDANTIYITGGEGPPPPPPPPPSSPSPPGPPNPFPPPPPPANEPEYLHHKLMKKSRAFAPGGIMDRAMRPRGALPPPLPPPAGNYVAELVKSSDGGSTWETMFHNKNVFEFNVISCSPTDPNHCCVLGSGFSTPPPASTNPGVRIYCWTDGKTLNRTYFAPESSTIVISDLQFVDDQTVWAVGGYGTQLGGAIFMLSTDGGASWTMQDNKIVGLAMAFEMVNSELGFANIINQITQSTGIAAYGGKGPAPPSPAPPAPPGETHYGDPNAGPCLRDEVPVQIQGVIGKVCSPDCSSTQPCPTDFPPGTGDVKPECVLEANGSQTPTNCILACTPGKKGECPPKGSCKSLQGTGLCTYDS